MTKLSQRKDAGKPEEMAPLSAAEIDCVSGALGLSVADAKQAELARRLEKAYAAAHPHEYYDFRI
jgi:hypothetical protein